jgi:hypothetical protein
MACDYNAHKTNDDNGQNLEFDFLILINSQTHILSL